MAVQSRLHRKLPSCPSLTLLTNSDIKGNGVNSRGKFMASYPGRYLSVRTVALLLALTATSILIPATASAQKASRKLTKQDVIDLLTHDLPSDAVVQEARKSGISFQVTPTVEREIRGAGGTDELISVLKSLAPPPPAPAPSNPTAVPAVLMVTSSPGQAEVYVDDEPQGSTSREGRLKLPHLSPGSHTVRVSLNGYQDHEEQVTLTAGTTASVSASLQKMEVAQILSAPCSPLSTRPDPNGSLGTARISRRSSHGTTARRVARRGDFRGSAGRTGRAGRPEGL